MAKVSVYSFKNKKPVFYELNRFYKVKSQNQMDKLVDKLLDLNIDAVSMPDQLSFPCVLEMLPGFSLCLAEVRRNSLKKEISELKELLD